MTWSYRVMRLDSTGHRILMFITGAAVLVGCAAIRTRLAREGSERGWAESRAQYIRRGQVWLGGDLESWLSQMRTLDLRAGPAGADAFAAEEVVRCGYLDAQPPLAGATPKFLCRRRHHGMVDTLKVKWGEENGEVYAEVASSRLLWALGFGTDAVYPVRVECSGCADDPWDDRRGQPGHVPPLFTPAVVERAFPGVTIEETREQGWQWDELNDIEAEDGGAPRAQVDALRLLGAFLQHRDNKASNQRLVCLPDSVTVERDGHRNCRRPFLLIIDLGSTFGGPAKIWTHKMDLDAWRRTPVWRDARRCIAYVDAEPAARDGLDNPRIGEPGRRFLAALLDGLDDAQLTALFTAARAEQRGGVENWVAVFKEKRRQIAQPVPEEPEFRCPERD
jgi:hypothetical protein